MMSFANGQSVMFINEMVEIIGNIHENPIEKTKPQSDLS